VLALTKHHLGRYRAERPRRGNDDFPGEQSRRQRHHQFVSPLDIGGGITAGNSIFLSTGGSPSSAANDMSLAGLYTYNISTGAFDVTVGVGGALTLFTGSTPLVLTAPLFPNPLNITQFTFLKDTGSIGWAPIR